MDHDKMAGILENLLNFINIDSTDFITEFDQYSKYVGTLKQLKRPKNLEKIMEKFIAATVKPVLIVGGLGTALAGANAFMPRFAVEKIQGLDWVQDYTIFVQHWGIMVCLIGVFMVAAAFIESWRTPIILYGLLEKAFMVFLVASNASMDYSNGFYVPAVMDAALTVYSILYFISLKKSGAR